MDIVNRLADIFFGIAMILPLAWSISIVLKLPKKKFNRFVVIPFALIWLIISLFLIFTISNTFLFPFYNLPPSLKIVWIFLFTFYWFGFGGVLYALGIISGQMGKSPSNIVKEIKVNLSDEK